MNVDRINSAIIQGNLTNDELTTVIEAVKYARSRLAEQTKRSLRIGDNVNWTKPKSGQFGRHPIQNVTGVVVKIAVKFVTVRTVQGLWKVPANMLTVVADEKEFA